MNLSDLSSFKEGTVVNEQLLRESKLVRGNGAGLKILGDGELKHALSIEADKVSASAREKIEKAGGSVTLRQKPVQGPREAEQPEQPTETTDTETAAKPKAKAAKKPAAKKKKTPAKSASKKKPRKS